MKLNEEKEFDLEQAAGEVYEMAEEMYNGSEINSDTLHSVMIMYFMDDFTADEMDQIDEYFKEQDRMFFAMYGKNKKVTEATDSTMDGKDVTNDFQMMKAFTSNFGPVKIIKNSYDKNYYIYKADETDSKNYIDFSKNKDYIEGWLSGAIKANNKIINSVTESVEGQDILTTLKQRKNAIIRLITKYDDVGDEDKIKDLNKKLQQVEIDIENYSNPDKPMIMSNLEESNTERKRIPTEDLPDLCYGYNHTTQEIIILKKGVMGYYPSKVNLDNLPEGTDRDQWAEDYVKEQNEILGVTEEQAQQMQINSMFGWEDTKMESKKLKTEVIEVGGEDISIDSIFHFPNVIEAMRETCREAIYELQNETDTPVTEDDVRAIYNFLDELQDKVDKYLEKANPDEDINESKKVESYNSDGFPNDEDLQKYFQKLGKLPDKIELDGITYNMEQYGGSGENSYVIYTDANNNDSYIKVFYSMNKVDDNSYKGVKEITGVSDLRENKKLNESTQQFIIGLTNKSVKELIEDETYDSYVKDIKAKDDGNGVEIELTDNKEEALKFENKIDAEIAASEIEQIQNDFSTVIVIAL